MANDCETIEGMELEDGLFNNSTSALKMSCRESDLKFLTTEPISESVTFVRYNGR
jgi:hypothetical protein